jgi:hypothetical protein
VLAGGARVAHWGAHKFGGAAWLLYGLFYLVWFFPPLSSQGSLRPHRPRPRRFPRQSVPLDEPSRPRKRSRPGTRRLLRSRGKDSHR